jgi:hypothetical protein
MDQLRSDMEGLLAEVSDLSRRNDELMTSKDSDLVIIRDLDVQLKEYKRKYEQAKTELRSTKGAHSVPGLQNGSERINSIIKHLHNCSCKRPSLTNSYRCLVMVAFRTSTSLPSSPLLTASSRLDALTHQPVCLRP